MGEVLRKHGAIVSVRNVFFITEVLRHRNAIQCLIIYHVAILPTNHQRSDYYLTLLLRHSASASTTSLPRV